MKNYLKLLRVKHYLKNFLIFVPLVFSGQIFEWNLTLKAFLGFVAFCLISSVVYIINDIKDVESDRNHPTKCNRPIASGKVKVNIAILIAVILFLLSAGFVILANGSVYSYVVIGGYFLINLAYSLGLKNIPIIDVTLLSSCFLLRVVFGADVTGIQISNWLYLTIIAGSFYMGLGKRRNELVRQTEGNTRKVLKFYNQNFLDKNMYLCLALAIVFYSLWCIDPVTIERLGNILWSVIGVLVICMKYSLTIEKDSDGDPVEVIFKDKLLLLLAGVFVVVLFLVIYVF